MPLGICSNHGQVEVKWKEGNSTQTGKAYAFWGCTKGGKNPDGTWQKCKVSVSETPAGKFDQDLDKSATQIDGQKKDKTITRLAIAKSMIEAGLTEPTMQTLAWAAKWVEWAEDRMPFAPKPPAFSPPPQQHPPTDIQVDGIPF